MIRQRISGRLDANDNLWTKLIFEFDPSDPYFIELIFPDELDDNDEEIVWTLGRKEMSEAIINNWPSGISDVIMIKFDKYLRMYLKNDLNQKLSLDVKLDKIKPFLAKTYKEVSNLEEQRMLLEEIGEISKWTSN